MNKKIERPEEWARVIEELEAEVAKLQSYDQTVLEHLGNVQDKYILDYGAGPAVMAGFLKGLGSYIKVYDISRDMRELAIEKIGRANVYDSVQTIPDHYFDIVLCNLVLCIVDEEEVLNILKNIHLKLRKGGEAFIGFCNPTIFSTKESNLDYRFPVEGKEYNDVHEYKKIKKEGGYEIVEKHRPIEWYKERIQTSGLQLAETIFTPEYNLKGNRIRDFIIFRLTR